MVDPDPWKILDKNYTPDNSTSNNNFSSTSACDFKEERFEDNFQPDILQSLPDSKEYLRSLGKHIFLFFI